MSSGIDTDHKPELLGLWYPVSFRYLLGRLGWRDRRFQCLLAGWVLFNLICIASGLVADSSLWVNWPVPILGKSAYVTIYPPTLLCVPLMFALGFEWAAIPSFLATFFVCLHDGMPVSWSLLIGLGDPLGLAVFALMYRSADLKIDLRSWRGVGWFIMTSLAAAAAGLTGAFVWSAGNHLDAAQTFLAWQGWLLGSTLGMLFLVVPVMQLTMRPWQIVRRRLFPVQPRRESSFVFVTMAIVAIGLVMTAFLTQTSYMATVRLVEALRNGVPPAVADAIRNAVASWQFTAWSAIAMVVTMMSVGLGHAYWWSARWTRQHEELLKAKRHAESALEIKSQFLATISHELRTPLNGMLGMNQLLFQTELTAEQCEYLTMADESANQLLELVNNVLDLARIEAGKLEIAHEPFDIRAMIGQIAKLLGCRMNSPQVSLNVTIDEHVPELLAGDEGRLRQIVTNLVGNAIKFTHRGSVSIRVDVPGIAPPSSLRIRVRDTGIGIAADVLPLLFQPFTQADSSTTRRFGGSGLGLAITQRLASAMGGEVSAESVLGQGSTFTVSVPVRSSIVQVVVPAIPPAGVEDKASFCR